MPIYIAKTSTLTRRSVAEGTDPKSPVASDPGDATPNVRVGQIISTEHGTSSPKVVEF
jgi:hypothetical protein